MSDITLKDITKDTTLKIIIIILVMVILFINILIFYKVYKQYQQSQVQLLKSNNQREQFSVYNQFWEIQEQLSKKFQKEQFLGMSDSYVCTPEEQNQIKQLKYKLDKFVENQINNPIEGTDPKRWNYILQNKMKNIQGLSPFEQYIQHQFAYTENKGELTKLCLKDSQGNVDLDLNMYVLLHELTHTYDTKYLPGVHDEYFWILFSKIIKRAISEGLLSEDIFKKSQCRCNTKIINKDDMMLINQNCIKILPSRK